ncbi:hypothetical protein N9H39_02630, partial [Gammaproteobacteria bacterium]|nr:hypothetical protein [Gammaproteobacteria bacterium]
MADYDFSKEISSAKITDVSSSGAHGVAVNLPNRAVRGRFWTGETIKWTERPDLYDAITFFVATPKGQASSRLAFWVSDYNYLAY